MLISPNVHLFHKIIIALSLLILGTTTFIEIKINQLSNNQRFFILGIALAILLNAWTSATFIYPVNRFGCKMIWLLPLLALCALLNYLKQQSRKKFDFQHLINDYKINTRHRFIFHNHLAYGSKCHRFWCRY